MLFIFICSVLWIPFFGLFCGCSTFSVLELQLGPFEASPTSISLGPSFLASGHPWLVLKGRPQKQTGNQAHGSEGSVQSVSATIYLCALSVQESCLEIELAATGRYRGISIEVLQMALCRFSEADMVWW